ncbi:MAG: 1,6-anhydro-N-acetylmuramyl-L-alanine amidase AmpD [Motiliproteus sp.]
MVSVSPAVVDFTLSEHWFAHARCCLSPNQNARPEGCLPELLVIHNISLPPGQFGGGQVQALFQNSLDPEAHPYFAQISALAVSAHLLLERDGALTQFVGFDRRAWHAGVSCYQGREGCNDFSIGIELEGCDDVPYSDIQYQQLATLITRLLQGYPTLSRTRIVGHSDIAPGRKTDPGPAFDWLRLQRLLATV